MNQCFQDLVIKQFSLVCGMSFFIIPAALRLAVPEITSSDKNQAHDMRSQIFIIFPGISFHTMEMFKITKS